MLRFWDKTAPRANGCRVWLGCRNRDGYGNTSVGGRLVLAHRLSWLLTRGPIPDGLNVLHRCDHPPCVNPEHLFVGTQRDNVEDMTQKGRRHDHRGVEHGMARLDEDRVRELRRQHRDGESIAALARRLRMAYSAVHAAVTGQTWRHVSDPPTR